jgi:hypothetical protein
MTKEDRKQNKAVEKIRKAIRKAIGKGVSQTVVENTVKAAVISAPGDDSDASEPTAEEKPRAKKISVVHKTGDITLKRGMNTKPMKSDPKKATVKKLPGKSRPRT